jgi:polyisoprenoid-binding protein YceI
MSSPKTSIAYVIDAGSSRFTVQAFASGILSAMGHNPTIGIRDFSGEVSFDASALHSDCLRVFIKMNSLSVLDDIPDKDRLEIERRMNDQVLELAKYPEAVYKGSEVSITPLEDGHYSVALNGMLNFHGVSSMQSITARVAVSGSVLTASGGFTLKQSVYGVRPVSVAGGALRIKDELKFSFEIVARQRE